MKLGSSSVAVDLKLPQSARSQLHSLTAAGAPAAPGAITAAWLVIADVEVGADGKNGGFSFNILATLPDGGQGSREVKVGQLGTFTWPTEDGSHGGHAGHLAPITSTRGANRGADLMMGADELVQLRITAGNAVTLTAAERERKLSRAMVYDRYGGSAKTNNVYYADDLALLQLASPYPATRSKRLAWRAQEAFFLTRRSQAKVSRTPTRALSVVSI
ncbi:hypothetical protein [Bradyrhizobium sp. CCBAU 11430]|uniref:hypothetical protein n=1 Tax=Bradyrhizobium sp. CCBAU 11430 TaxID=1630881 RepID=UPI002304EB6A|nr:hypothetical protein [Bradyrhizobium sp. CCBAU 11430]